MVHRAQLHANYMACRSSQNSLSMARWAWEGDVETGWSEWYTAGFWRRAMQQSTTPKSFRGLDNAEQRAALRLSKLIDRLLSAAVQRVISTPLEAQAAS